jgi:hypothetical protein
VDDAATDRAEAVWCVEATYLLALVGGEFGLSVEPIEMATVVANPAAVNAAGAPTPVPVYPERCAVTLAANGYPLEIQGPDDPRAKYLSVVHQEASGIRG